MKDIAGQASQPCPSVKKSRRAAIPLAKMRISGLTMNVGGPVVSLPTTAAINSNSAIFNKDTNGLRQSTDVIP